MGGELYVHDLEQMGLRLLPTDISAASHWNRWVLRDPGILLICSTTAFRDGASPSVYTLISTNQLEFEKR